MKILRQFFVVLALIFFSINFLSCMEQDSEPRNRDDVVIPMQEVSLPGQLNISPRAGEAPIPPRNKSAVRRFFRELSQQVGLSQAAQEGNVNPGVNRIIDSMDAHYDESYKILDLSFARTQVRLTLPDFSLLFPHIVNFMISRDVRVLDLRDNHLAADGLPAVVIIYMLENERLAVVFLEGNPLCDVADLSFVVRNFGGRLNECNCFLKKFFKGILGGLINCDENVIEIQDAAFSELVSKDQLILDFGQHKQYRLKKILNHAANGYLQRISPAISKVLLTLITVGGAWLSSYCVREFIDNGSCDMESLEEYLYDICLLNSTAVSNLLGIG